MDSQQENDQRINQRINFYKPQPTKDDYFDQRQNFATKIRRDNKNSVIHRKRLNGISAENLIHIKEISNVDMSSSGSLQHNMIIINGQSQDPDQHIQVLQLLQKLMQPEQIVEGIAQDKKKDLLYLRELRQALIAHQDELTFHQFILKGGIKVLTSYIIDSKTNQQSKEEAIWALTNLSIFSGSYEADFMEACEALLHILHSDKIDNLGSLLNLKQQCLKTLGNLAIDSEKMRHQIANFNGNGLKTIIDLIYFNRAPLTEQCFWTLNNFLIADFQYNQLCIQQGLCKAINNTIDKVQVKSEDLLSEMLWCLHYLIRNEEQVAQFVCEQIPNLHKKLAAELESSVSITSNIVRPIINILGNIIPLRLEYGHDLMYDEKFQTFILTILFQPDDQNLYKKECLWVLSNILAGPSEHNFEFILENKNLLEQIIHIASSQDYQVKKEALVTLYNLCENHQNRYLQKVMSKNPSQAFFQVLQNYFTCDPYLLKVSISFCSLICEKYPEQAIKLIQQENISEMIENIQYKYEQNPELVQLSSSFLEKYIYNISHDAVVDESSMHDTNNEKMSFNI
ncbi:importin subunit alpha-2-like [Stylonychia lemnae]|uniref:Importin subunit alpha-2-like n=1 Tax=Stylonychia lemnae TaxID=5949 RepID=A0A078AB75_STYLE|nr:importin subunit alpha-2-like [Stylonychia lemnae]|eukprot:CDW78857.1 importin subunit alpha-2-like [Stylonychia lemnae]